MEARKMNVLGGLWRDKLELVLRIGVFGVFLGHGVFAMEGKQRFVEMIQSIVPIDATSGTSLLFAIGITDILIAFLVLLRPQKHILAYATIWAFMTAVARVTAGDPIWDFVERAANWAAPLALLLYIQYKSNTRKESAAITA